MSKSSIREDKTCLNCQHVVEDRFCSHCGQENTETRKTFYELFFHFFEDLVHYENSFWKTIRSLIFKPGFLTKEYLSGKRNLYLPPIRLYIFTSITTFFLLSILPDKEPGQVSVNHTAAKRKMATDTTYQEQQKIADLEAKGYLTKKESESIQKLIVDSKEKRSGNDVFVLSDSRFTSMQELDSLQKYGNEKDKLSAFEYWFRKKEIELGGKSREEVMEKLMNSITRNIPKSLFIYMPLFAFVLWLFHDKKRWYYFDHGIFTLHYFSFLLLGILIIELVQFLLELPGFSILNLLSSGVGFVGGLYMVYYFFPASRRFYEQRKTVTLTKGLAVLFINTLLLTLLIMGLVTYSFVFIH